MSKVGDNCFGVGITRRRVLIVTLLLVVAWGVWYVMRISAGYDGEKAVWIRIPREASPEAARDSIVGALGGSFGGRVASMWSGNVDASHGAYRIEPGERAWRIARRIGQGRQTPVRITFNNVRTLQELAKSLSGKMDFTADAFMAACRVIADADTVSMFDVEAQFLPDTYEMYWSAAPADLIAKIRRHYHRFWTPERCEKAGTIGLTPVQVSVLASIVEEESNRRDEYGKIARLYLNRLRRGMLLQADPTVKFATGDFAARRITAEMLKVESPYNTYKVAGLPPSVIRLPEAATIDAVLNAPEHGYIYMCARPDGSGYHDFTSDYSTHLANARRFRCAAYSSMGREQ